MKGNSWGKGGERIYKSSTSARPVGISVLTRLKLKRDGGNSECICVIRGWALSWGVSDRAGEVCEGSGCHWGSCELQEQLNAGSGAAHPA